MSERSGATETPRQRWARRALTLPGTVLAGAALLALLPVALPLFVLVDLVRRERFARTRILLFALHYVACELLGLVASGGLWLARLPGFGGERYLSRHYALQDFWARLLFAGVRALFGLRLEAEGPEPLPGGPLLVFVRHASLVDTLLPALLVSGRHGLRLRYVLKRELLWDPCLDVVGNRLPNLFIRRGASDSAAELAKLTALASGLREGEGVLIYPEGTRFTPDRRARALARIERSGNARRLERVRRLHHVLPPRTGGPMALLEACPEADVLVVAHVGLEGLSHLRDIWHGSLIGRRIRAQLWRLPRSGLPREREKQIEWLDDAWARVDAWIGQELARERGSDRGPSPLPADRKGAPRGPLERP